MATEFIKQFIWTIQPNMRTFIAIALLAIGCSGMAHKKAKKAMMTAMETEFYVVDNGQVQCNEIPDETMTGNPMMDGCKAADASDDEEVCLCAKKDPMMVEAMGKSGMDMTMLDQETGFMNMCGSCWNPCALKWKPKVDPMQIMGMGVEMVGNMMEMENRPMPPMPREVQALVKMAMDIMQKRKEMGN